MNKYLLLILRLFWRKNIPIDLVKNFIDYYIPFVMYLPIRRKEIEKLRNDEFLLREINNKLMVFIHFDNSFIPISFNSKISQGHEYFDISEFSISYDNYSQVYHRISESYFEKVENYKTFLNQNYFKLPYNDKLHQLGDQIWHSNLSESLPVSLNLLDTIYSPPFHLIYEKFKKLRIRKNSNNKLEGTCAIYGMTKSVGNKDIIDEVAVGYLDALTEI